MCDVHLMIRMTSAELNSQLGIECMTDVARRSRFGHVERRDSDVWVSVCTSFEVDGVGLTR